MVQFLKELVEGDEFELYIDKNIFPVDICLKAAYNFLDKGYFFFKLDEKGDIILHFTKKEGVSLDPKKLIMSFWDELLSVLLRHKLETDNKEIRERIVSAAIWNSFDEAGFTEFDTNVQQQQEKNQIDFDKDIDEILKEIENDPELKIDDGEIDRILKEIELETETEIQKPQITLDPNALKNAKEKFQSK